MGPQLRRWRPFRFAKGKGNATPPASIGTTWPAPDPGNVKSLPRPLSRTPASSRHGQRPERPARETMRTTKYPQPNHIVGKIPCGRTRTLSGASPERTEPTPLLNHETSDHLLSLVENVRACLAREEECESSRAAIQALFSPADTKMRRCRSRRRSAAAILDHASDLGIDRHHQRRPSRRLDHEPPAAERHRVEQRIGGRQPQRRTRRTIR